MRRNSVVIRSLDGGKTWETFTPKPKRSNVRVVRDHDSGKLKVKIYLK